MNIRNEQSHDITQIESLNTTVFETAAEAKLVNALRDSGCEYISLVAETNNKIIGHILFTPVELSNSENKVKIMGLAPMAVLNEYQNKGIGTQLIKAGLAQCKTLSYEAVVVLGYPAYYSKFGFESSTDFGIKSEYDVPAEAFMVLELKAGVLKDHKGIIKYHHAFSEL